MKVARYPKELLPHRFMGETYTVYQSYGNCLAGYGFSAIHRSFVTISSLYPLKQCIDRIIDFLLSVSGVLFSHGCRLIPHHYCASTQYCHSWPNIYLAIIRSNKYILRMHFVLCIIDITCIILDRVLPPRSALGCPSVKFVLNVKWSVNTSDV